MQPFWLFVQSGVKNKIIFQMGYEEHLGKGMLMTINLLLIGIDQKLAPTTYLGNGGPGAPV